MRTRIERSGMLLVMVLIVAAMLLVMGMAVWRANQTDVTQNTTNVRRVQAQYLAKGALQLALLKARLFPTPLYDSAAFSVGKNPYYVHSAGYSHFKPVDAKKCSLIPGPAFLTGESDISTDGLVRTNVKHINGGGNDKQADDLNSEDGIVPGAGDYVVDRYLNFFALDLASRKNPDLPKVNEDPSVQIAGQDFISISDTEACKILGGKDPYSGRFRILSISVQGAAKNQLYGEETLRVVAVATIKSKIAGTTKVGDETLSTKTEWSEREEMLYRVKRPY
ncbi:MAG: hypothetical protein HY303_04580 [Candidatus Wallbacteria bacterium]|nr:hypothetical protein [Candidatus Wallbacteria bacterium]